MVTQTCKHRRPWAVFLGTSAALIPVTAIGAVRGQLLGQIIPERALRIVVALAFVMMGPQEGGWQSFRESAQWGAKTAQVDPSWQHRRLQ
ncbi:MAG: TMEM165/GDT1 family protein [Chloroflexi bacterium]|nr:TMEM165/GDT1 family protein [Chloroflexota bacterium]